MVTPANTIGCLSNLSIKEWNMNATSMKVSKAARAASCGKGKRAVPLHPHVIIWCAVLIAGVLMAGMGAWAGTPPARDAGPIAKPSHLAEFVNVQAAAMRLGKALLRDM
jgi:hypothetical protein